MPRRWRIVILWNCKHNQAEFLHPAHICLWQCHWVSPFRCPENCCFSLTHAHAHSHALYARQINWTNRAVNIGGLQTYNRFGLGSGNSSSKIFELPANNAESVEWKRNRRSTRATCKTKSAFQQSFLSLAPKKKKYIQGIVFATNLCVSVCVGQVIRFISSWPGKVHSKHWDSVARVSQSKIRHRDANTKKFKNTRRVEKLKREEENILGEKRGKLGAVAGVDNQLRKSEKLRPQHYKCG